MTECFVQRAFMVENVEVPCRIFGPIKDGKDFRCRFEILWTDGVQSREAWGVDEVQALLLAMQMAHCDLLVRREREGKEITWLGQRRLGLPIPEGFHDLDSENPVS